MPPGRDGVYYFSTHLTINQDDFGIFSIELNGDVICSALGDQNTSSTGDSGATSCSAIADVVAGKISISSVNRVFVEIDFRNIFCRCSLVNTR